MMTTIAGYQLISAIHEGVNTVIYRAQREADKTYAIVKALKAEYPTLEELTRLRHEYKILQHLDIKGIVKAYSLENYNNGQALILSDFRADSLKNFIASQKLSVSEFLNIAIQLADTLAQLHENHIIHKDIKPHNILINAATGQVKITDFSISTRLCRENPSIGNPKLLEGTLVYMSPEQTGRMNRSIDYRTDFYSLGVTFYEMLTGRVPFESTDPMELIHCHIAKMPVPPHVGALTPRPYPEVPEAVSDIVMKLLAKTAEDRYQSALGLKADLETCLNELQSTGNISNFPIGRRDKFGQFLIPQKLYGRENEVSILMDAFERVSSGTSEMMLVSGYSGIGKSSLVNEVHKPIVRQRGYFISGKFDQFKRNIPYASLIQAFQELIRQLLTESSEKIAVCQEELLKAIGSNGSVIIDVIPEVELIVGSQPPVPQLGPAESQNRFNRVFQEFIHVFTKPEHPLVLFLDDLQWADSASLNLIQLLISDPDSQYLLLMGAYRDNEVSSTHPLILTLDEIKKIGAIVNNIILQSLDIGNVSQLVAETLHDETQRSLPLAELVFNKTQGNPFFLTQLLSTLHDEKLLTFDFSSGCWQWDIGQIQAIGITDYNVVELIARNIQKLPEETQRVLKLAACIGDKFNLDVLAIVQEKSQSETAADLWDALQAGLILPLSKSYKIPLVFDSSIPTALKFDELKVSYKFLHDRVQQAAYSLIPESEKQQTHHQVGELLLKHTPPDEIEENIFEIVNQLNIGVEFITHQAEKDELAQLNLIAGKKAKAATAYETAVRYLTVALGLLREDSWETQYDFTLDLYVEATAAEFLNTNFEQAKTLSEVVLKHAKTLLDKVKVYELQVQFYIPQNEMLSALDIGLQALDMLGVSLCQEPPGEIDIEALANLPEMTAADKLVAMRILMLIGPPAYIVAPAMFPQIPFTMIDLSIKYGNSALAAIGYGFYGLMLCGSPAGIDSGYRFGQLAVKLIEQFDARSLKAQISTIFNAHIRHWKEHAKETLASLLEGIQSGLETGTVDWAGYNSFYYCDHIFFTGEPLELVAQKQAQHLEAMRKLKQEMHSSYIKAWRVMVLKLLDAPEEEYRFYGEILNEEEILQRSIAANKHMFIFAAYLAKAIRLYLFKDYAGSVAIARLAEKHEEGVAGLMTGAEHKFYYSLALLAQYPQVSNGEGEQSLDMVAKNQEKMQQWADLAPANYWHKYELVEAEKARVLGQVLEAMESYDRAIQGAKEAGYIQEEALANELAAEFYFSRGKEKVGQVYLTEAYYGYIRWGAKSKVSDLEARYPQVFCRLRAIATNAPEREPASMDVTKTTTLSTGFVLEALDFATVMKASLALSSEIVLGKLLSKLMKIAIENAGAQTGCLILEKDGQLLIEATGAVDRNEVVVLQSTPVETSLHSLPVSVLNYVSRTQENVVLNDASREGIFTTDPYITKNQPKSVLCTPIIYQGKFIGIVYLENNLTYGAFTPERLEVLKILSSQAAISIENALLYANLSLSSDNLKLANEQLEDYSRTLEHKVEERTLELKEKNGRLIREIGDRQRTEEALRQSSAQLRNQAQQLEQALHDLKQTQSQLIQTEKMASLGQLVAGVAHEINNPVSFIYGNITHANQYTQELLQLLDLYQQEYPNPTSKILAQTEAIELDFLREDLQKLLFSMKVGAERIREIVHSLRNFSRLDEAQMKPVDIHQGIDNTLLILQNRLKAKPDYPCIQIVKEYGNLPSVDCYAGQLNQVFMNILANAIDVLEEYNRQHAEEIKANPSTISIRTEVTGRDRIIIRIADNGPGMTEQVRKRLFDPFFTTKPVGKGTGLGLSISYHIVVDKHGGSLQCISAPGLGAEFIIEIPMRQLALRTA